MFLGLNTSSAKATVDVLKAGNFDAMGPEPGSIMTGDEKTPPPPMWEDVYTPDKPAKGKRVLTLPIFFIQYLDQKQRDADRFSAAATNHPNGALGVRAGNGGAREPPAMAPTHSPSPLRSSVVMLRSRLSSAPARW